jgi:hypothetical protein
MEVVRESISYLVMRCWYKVARDEPSVCGFVAMPGMLAATAGFGLLVA